MTPCIVSYQFSITYKMLEVFICSYISPYPITNRGRYIWKLHTQIADIQDKNINRREPRLENTDNVFCITMLKPLENKAMYLNSIKQKDVETQFATHYK